MDRSFDSAASPAWRAFFGAFAPLGRLMGPVSRKLMRVRGGPLGALDVSPDKSGDTDTSVVTATKAMSPGLQAAELKAVLSDFAR